MAKVVVSVQVEPEQRDELERRAAADDRTISYVLRRAVAQYLEHEDRSGLHPQPQKETR